jgi:hypothetical protein
MKPRPTQSGMRENSVVKTACLVPYSGFVTLDVRSSPQRFATWTADPNLCALCKPGPDRMSGLTRSEWWAWVDLNHRPRPYQGRALAT